MGSLRRHIARVFVLAGLWAFFIVGRVSCPFFALTGKPCPTCGVTRALWALLQGDAARYWHYQPMALPLVAAVGLCLHLRVLQRPYRQAAAVVSCGILLANGLVYFARLRAGFVW